jgi:peptidyl-prolyl cis-trans isomerase SurA
VPIDRAELADEAKRAADRIMDQLRRGAPFGAVAQQFSQGATAQAGGELGWVLPGSLDPALDNAVEKLPLRQPSEPIRSTSGYHILYVIERRTFAAARPDDLRLNLTQMTLPLPVNASADEVAKATAEAQKAMQGVRSCNDLHARARDLRGATSGDLSGIRVGDLQANQQMYEALPKLNVGGTAGPFRVAEGLQVVALCGKLGGDGMLSRDVISQQLLLQKLEAAGRRYMRELRRQATVDVKQPS